MNKKGLITVKMLIFSTMTLTIALSLFLFLKQWHVVNSVLRDQSGQVNSSLANFDSYLYKNYGLYGGLEISESGSFESGFSYKVLSESLVATGDLADDEVIKGQVATFMTYRMAGNYIEQMANKLEIIAKSDETKATLNLKSKVYDLLTAYDDLVRKRALYTLEINSFDKVSLMATCQEINQVWRLWRQGYKELLDNEIECLEAYEAAVVAYEAAKASGKVEGQGDKMTACLQALEYAQSQLMDYTYYAKDSLGALEGLKADLEGIALSHDFLIQTLVALQEDKGGLVATIDDTLVEVSHSKGIKSLLEAIDIEMVGLKKGLEAEGISDESLAVIKAQVQANKAILSQLNSCLAYGADVYDRDVLIQLPEGLDLGAYKNNFDLCIDQDFVANPDHEAIYKGAKEKNDKAYDPSTSGDVIGGDVAVVKIKEEGGFWAATGLLDHLKDRYQDLQINEYLMSTFRAYASPSATDMDFFDKYNKASFFKNADIEYIIFGHDSEAKNIKKSMVTIYGVRTLMNTIHIYTDPEKMALSEGIGWGVAGWTGFLAPLVTQVIRVAWAAGESGLDMVDLVKGQGVAFLKIYPSQWQLDLGLALDDKSQPQVSKALDFTYHDYLRIMLLTVKTDTKVARLQNLLSLDLYAAQRPYRLSSYKTSYASHRVIDLDFGDYESVLERGYE